MGRPKISCLKLIACGDAGHPASSDDDLSPSLPESKASSDKCRWNFRKRSGRHRVLSNTLTSDPISVGYNKESPETAVENFHSPKKSSVSEKVLIEEPPLPSHTVNSELVDLQVSVTNTATKHHRVEDSFAVVIQATIRGYLARRELHNINNVVKLQAAVRGHLVRRQAIGTLRCFQAIIKMQALVRSRQAHQYDEKFKMDTKRSFPLGNAISSIQPNKPCSSTEKLLSNRFASQLLEFTPKKIYIPIRCDPSRSDSAWKWFERWMVVTSLHERQQQQQNLNLGYHENEEHTKSSANGVPEEKQQQEENHNQGHHENEENIRSSTDGGPNEVPLAVVSISSDLESAPDESALQTQVNSVLEFQPAVSIPNDSFISLVKNAQDQSYLAVEALGLPPDNSCYIERVTEKASEFLLDQRPMQPNETAESTHIPTSDKPESDGNPELPTKRTSSETPECEGEKILFGCRKPCNPVFAAVQSKFEELSSTSSVGKSVNPAPSPSVDSLTKTKDLNHVETFLSHEPGIQVATSECGTEISISSTLDSTDRSEAGGVIVLEIGYLGKGNYVVSNAANNDPNLVDTNIETETSSKDSQVLEPQRLVEDDGDITNSVLVAAAPRVTQQAEESITSNKQSHMEISVDPKVYRSSPEGTPRSHTLVLESHGTPSSEVAIYAKKGKKDGNTPSQNQRPQVMGKRSPSTPNNSSGGRSGTGSLPRDLKSGKRRNSFGMAKPDHVDHEPRISSSNSLPSYMQATESARAKALASISPKSSPDVHDKDNYLKKRHSLPITNGKQGTSPRMQRSASQAQPSKNENSTNSPHSSAERRWKR